MVLVYFNQKPIYLSPVIAERFGLQEGSQLPCQLADQIIYENALYLSSPRHRAEEYGLGDWS
ncbi:hypothetical protein [Spirosoma harenae]